MKVFARLACAAALAPYEQALLLEGAWPLGGEFDEGRAAGRWSLDEAIDAADAWIDAEAQRLAAELTSRATSRCWRTFVELNQLKLRYYFVKLLRPLAFFRRHEPEDGCLDLHLAAGQDDDYAKVFKALTAARGWRLKCATDVPARREPLGQECPSYQTKLRRWAGEMTGKLTRPTTAGQPFIAYCGDRRLLEPVCRELLQRGFGGTWLYERFALKTWLRLGLRGVQQWTCDELPATDESAFGDAPLAAPLVSRGVDLSRAVNVWLKRAAKERGPRQQGWLKALDDKVAESRPVALVLDEDATPFPRAAIQVAKRHGVPSIVVQHGVPRVRFGFAPPMADVFCAWGESSRRQLIGWGTPAERICVTGAPFVAPQRDRNRTQRRAGRNNEILLLATTPPSDARPDSVAFHLTTAAHEQMLRMACRAAARISGARLTVKLHPRCRDRRPFESILAEFPELPSRIVVGRSLASCLSKADCVLNCTSGAGLEAAYAGHSVIDLIPDGGDDLLPAAEWGSLGTARCDEELHNALDAALSRAADSSDFDWQDVFASVGRIAAKRVADVVLECISTPRVDLPALSHPITRWPVHSRTPALPHA
jgi:hypothetical protein